MSQDQISLPLLLSQQDKIRNNLNNSQSSINHEYSLPSEWKIIQLLLWKNFLLFQRNKKSLVFLAIGPLIICSLLSYFGWLANRVIDTNDLNPESTPAQQMISCQDNPFNDFQSSCITIGYAIIGTPMPWIDYALNFTKQVNQLPYQDDIKLLYSGNDFTLQQYISYFTQNPGKVSYGIIFCNDQIQFQNYTFDCQNPYFPVNTSQVPIIFPNAYTYLIYLNNTLYETLITVDQNSFPMKQDAQALALQISLDSAIIAFTQNETLQNQKFDAIMKVYEQSYPIAPNRFLNNFDVITSVGSFYFFLMPMFLFILFQNEMIREQEYRLRQGLSLFGSTNFAFWSSWIITSLFFSFLLSLITVIFGIIFEFHVFKRAPFFLMLLLFFVFTFAMQVVTFLLFTIVKNQKSSNTAGYGLLLLAIVIELFICNANVNIIFYVTDPPPAAWVAWFKLFLILYPPYNYSQIFGDICLQTGYYLDFNARIHVQGPGYFWSDLTQNVSGQLPGPDHKITKYRMTTDLFSFSMFFVDILFFALLAWYFDNIEESNRGFGQPKTFIFSIQYWKSTCKSLFKSSKVTSSQNQIDTISKESMMMSQSGISLQPLEKQELKVNASIDQEQQQFQTGDYNQKSEYSNNLGESLNLQDDTDSSVIEEIEEIRNRVSKGIICKGIRICNLNKNYFVEQSCCCCCVKEKVQTKALSKLFLEIQSGEMLGLLGHNGAGQTTLVNILTGLLKPDSGSVTIDERDLSENIEQVRRSIGVCPQFDILWLEMTADEHLQLFGRLRGIPEDQIGSMIAEKLEKVGLTHVRHAASQTFSGGMKRRLSLAIASVGQPKILLMDEPTTGMDPQTRREIWSLMKEIQENKAMILTTHSMEEADVLCDRIAVLVDGKLQCIGSSLDLKHKFGEGYRLNFVIEDGSCERVQEILFKMIRSCSLIDQSGRNLVFQVKSENLDQISKFSSLYYNQPCSDINYADDINFLKANVVDWGISHSTLEDVFMKVTGKKQNKASNRDSKEKRD